MVVKNIKDIEAKEISPGVMERILVKPEETVSKITGIKHLTIETRKKYASESGASETILYAISGYGNLGYSGIFVPRYHVLFEFEGGKFSIMPPSRKFFVENVGEGLFRVLMIYYRLPKMVSKGSVEIFDKDFPPRQDRLACTDSLVLLPPEMVIAKGLEKFSVLEYEIYHPYGGKREWTSASNVESCFYVLRGEGKATIDNKEYEITAGSAVYIPPATSAFLENVGKDVLVFLFAAGKV